MRICSCGCEHEATYQCQKCEEWFCGGTIAEHEYAHGWELVPHQTCGWQDRVKKLLPKRNKSLLGLPQKFLFIAEPVKQKFLWESGCRKHEAGCTRPLDHPHTAVQRGILPQNNQKP